MRSQPRNILIAVDASKHSFEAVRYVGRILPPEETRITLLHILPPFPEQSWGLDVVPALREREAIDAQTWKLQQRRTIQDFLERARELLEAMGYPREAVSGQVKEREAGVARDIAQEAQRGCDALVVGRRGMTEVEDLILGSIANKLVSHLSRVTVWVVGGCPDPGKVLVAMDSSEGARRALEYVARLFGHAHPELLLFHVTREIDFFPPGYEEVTPDGDWLERCRRESERAERVMESVFETCVKYLESQGGDANRITTRIVPGIYSRAAAIFGEARQEGCGTIVVGRRGLSRMEEFLMGRVSNKVLQLAQEMAVWVVH